MTVKLATRPELAAQNRKAPRRRSGDRGLYGVSGAGGWGAAGRYLTAAASGGRLWMALVPFLKMQVRMLFSSSVGSSMPG